MTLPWGIVLLIPTAILLFLGKAKSLARDCYLSSRGLLLIIFLVLISSFIVIPLTAFGNEVYLNIGGVFLPSALAIYIFSREKRSGRGRVIMVSVLVFAFSFCFSLGLFWRLNEVMIDYNWLLPLVCGFLAAAFGGDMGTSAAGIISGILAMDMICVVSGIKAGEIGGLAAIDLWLLSFAYAWTILKIKAQITNTANYKLQITKHK
jgi:hypothetical protein